MRHQGCQYKDLYLLESYQKFHQILFGTQLELVPQPESGTLHPPNAQIGEIGDLFCTEIQS